MLRRHYAFSLLGRFFMIFPYGPSILFHYSYTYLNIFCLWGRDRSCSNGSYNSHPRNRQSVKSQSFKMLTILISTILLLPSAWLVPKPWLWTTLTVESLIIASFSTKLLQNHTIAPVLNINILWSDDLSSPLLSLTCWLLPLLILAGAATKYEEPEIHQRIYINAIIFLQIFLITAFSAYDFTLFYILFEATIIPTLLMITRWGPQSKRLLAGSQFIFYTLIGSLPLLIALIYLWCTAGSQVFPLLSYLPQPSSYLELTNSSGWPAS